MRARWGDYGVVLNCGEREWKLLHLLYVENAKKIQKERQAILMVYVGEGHWRDCDKVQLEFRGNRRSIHIVCLYGEELKVVEEFKSFKVKFSRNGVGELKLTEESCTWEKGVHWKLW